MCWDNPAETADGAHETRQLFVPTEPLLFRSEPDRRKKGLTVAPSLPPSHPSLLPKYMLSVQPVRRPTVGYGCVRKEGSGPPINSSSFLLPGAMTRAAHCAR